MGDLQQLMQQFEQSLAWIAGRNDWLQTEQALVPACDGVSKTLVRTWMHNLRSAADRIPHGQNVDTSIQKLIMATARGDLFQETEVFLSGQPNRDQTPYLAILAHVALLEGGGQKGETGGKGGVA
jgi:hypothetical protein